jgi:hypothetical protein
MANHRSIDICKRVGAIPLKPNPESKLGIAISTLGKLPINGLRHKATASSCGWYLWCGTELSDAPNFFSPIHVEHLSEYLPSSIQYLDLPPGFRFLIDNNGHEDVWFEEALLEV